MTKVDDWKQELSDILGSYFGDQSIQEGVFELIFSSKEDYSFHETLEIIFLNGLEAIEREDQGILEEMKKQVFISSFQDARSFLEQLKNEYDRQYKLTTDIA